VRGYVDTRWGQLHYQATGPESGDAPTLVLLHETPLNHHAFERIVPLLNDRYRVIALDSPGYGRSDGPDGPTTAEEYATTVAEGLDGLGVGRAVPYGVHTGGTVAVALAVLLGERTAGLVLTGVPYYSDEVRAARRVRQIPPITEDGSHLLDTFLWEPASYDAEMRSRLVSGVAEDPVNGYLAFHAVYAYQPAKVLNRITCPVLLLSHEADPLFDCDGRFAGGVADARQVIVDTERLPVYWTKPQTVAGEIADFLESL
jgi:pimeloyl-ACP methyl ester carboxylesterase